MKLDPRGTSRAIKEKRKWERETRSHSKGRHRCTNPHEYQWKTGHTKLYEYWRKKYNSWLEKRPRQKMGRLLGNNIFKYMGGHLYPGIKKWKCSPSRLNFRGTVDVLDMETIIEGIKFRKERRSNEIKT